MSTTHRELQAGLGGGARGDAAVGMRADLQRRAVHATQPAGATCSGVALIVSKRSTKRVLCMPCSTCDRQLGAHMR